MKSTYSDQRTWMVGEFTDGQFWCSTETADEQHARDVYERYRKTHPHQRVQLIQQVKTFKIVEHHHPELRA